jgi:NADPH2:quinone reductase
MECAGHIASVGDGIDPARVGERVIVGAQYGCYAELVAVAAQQALPAVADFSVEENAAFAVNFMTAWVSLMEMARLRPTDRVLITAAAGGVGTAAVKIAKAFGCRVYGAVGSAAKLPLLENLGVDRAVSYGEPGFAERVREASAAAGDDPPGVDVVLEVVGGDVFRDSKELLVPFGRIVVAGFAGYELRRWNPLSWYRTWRDMPKAGISELATTSRGLLASHIGYLLKDPDRMARLWDDLTDFCSEHDLRPVVGSTFPLDQISAAHAFMESRGSTGKIVVLP